MNKIRFLQNFLRYGPPKAERGVSIQYINQLIKKIHFIYTEHDWPSLGSLKFASNVTN